MRKPLPRAVNLAILAMACSGLLALVMMRDARIACAETINLLAEWKPRGRPQ